LPMFIDRGTPDYAKARMQQCRVVFALSSALPRPASVSGIEWQLSSFSRSVRKI
jgi:hypothetical protein